MNEQANCTLGSIENAIGLGLAFIELTVERCFENWRVMSRKFLVDNELLQERNSIVLANVDSDKILGFPVRELEDEIVPRHDRRLTQSQDPSSRHSSEKMTKSRCLSPSFVLHSALI